MRTMPRATARSRKQGLDSKQNKPFLRNGRGFFLDIPFYRTRPDVQSELMVPQETGAASSDSAVANGWPENEEVIRSFLLARHSGVIRPGGRLMRGSQVRVHESTVDVSAVVADPVALTVPELKRIRHLR
jgi:hypothetical protein